MSATTWTVTSVLTEIGNIVTQGLAWAGNVVTFVMDNPLILIFCAIPLVGLGIGMVKRMISL